MRETRLAALLLLMLIPLPPFHFLNFPKIKGRSASGLFYKMTCSLHKIDSINHFKIQSV